MMRLGLLALMVLPLAAIADFTATGTVTNAKTGKALEGATVLIKGTTLGTFTDEDGRFNLSGIPDGAQTLIVRYTGFKTYEYDLGNGLKDIKIALKAQVFGKNNLLVCGYLAYNQSMNIELGYGLKGGVS